MKRRSTPPGRSVSPASAGLTGLDANRLASAFDALSDAAVVVDEAGNEIVRNHAAERFRDARHSDALAQHAIEALLTAARRGQAGERELSLFGPPREVLQMRAVPLRDARGTTVGAAAFVRDVTEARRVESVRRDFVANVSHELKTPVGALGLLAETISASDDPQVTTNLTGRMVKEAERLARIVDDLLDLSLLEAEEAPTREHVAVRVLLDEAADRLAPMALAHAIPVHVHDVPDDLFVSCNPAQIVSALTNLLDNAVKYSDPGGIVEVTAEKDGATVVLAVEDHGIGIPSIDLVRVFERFYRVDRARSRDTGGTGLGLSIVRHVAQVHGGDVTVESVEGEGTTFRMLLPRVGAQARASSAVPAERL